MKIVVIGGTGLIGTITVGILRGKGHDVVAASPGTGVNAVSGEGLAAALEGAEIVIDVSNSPSFEDQAVLDFFTASSRNLAAAELAARVKHHVALSVVGTERLQASGYFRAKLVQEDLIKGSPVPYTILRATQFFEFMGGIAYDGTDGDAVRLSSAQFQPIASGDVAAALADVALAAPVNGTIEVAGPQVHAMNTLVEAWMRGQGDMRPVTAAQDAPYFGTALDDGSLTPGAAARIMPTRFEDWMKAAAA